MKLKIQRFSGLPVSEENLTAYNAEFKSAYDAIIEECGQDMLAVHERLKALDEQLSAKWTNIEMKDLPKSGKAWKNLIDELQAPLMIAKSSEADEIVLVIMDQPLL